MLKSLDFSGCLGVTDAGIAHLCSVVHRLEELRLDGLQELSDDGLEVLFAFSSSGEEGTRAHDFSAASSSSSSSSPRLRLLSLAGCAGVTDEGVRRLATSPLASSLRDLNISKTSATEGALVWITGLDGRGGGLRELQRISLPAHGRGITGMGLRALASRDALTALDLEGCSGPGVTSEALAGRESSL